MLPPTKIERPCCLAFAMTKQHSVDCSLQQLEDELRKLGEEISNDPPDDDRAAEY